MSSLYNDFEKRFTDEFFSSGWIEIEAKPQIQQSAPAARKDLQTLESELQQIQDHIEFVSEKKLRLANLAKLYE